MKRRIFLQYTARVGFLLPAWTGKCVLGQVLGNGNEQPTHWLSAILDRIEGELNQDSIGRIGNISIKHVYPAQPQWMFEQATSIARQDIDALFEGLGNIPPANLPAFSDKLAAQFGSFAFQVTHNGIQLNWQALAYSGGRQGKATRVVLIEGSKGILHTVNNEVDYHIQPFAESAAS